jgi:hypothetical protein
LRTLADVLASVRLGLVGLLVTTDQGPEFTHRQGLGVVAVAALFGGSLIAFGGDEWFQLGVISLSAVAATALIQRHLVRKPWFLAFLALMIAAHLGAVLAYPAPDLSRGAFGLLALADLIAVLALAMGLEKIVAGR